MRKSFAIIIPALAALAVAACQPEPTPEQKAMAAAQQMAQQMAGGMLGVDANGNPQIDPKAMGAALAQAGAMASAMNPEMTAEDRAKLNAISGAIASGNVHPAAASYVAGLDKVFNVLSGIKDEAGADAAKPQIAAIYAEMAPAAATLKGMSDDDRDVAFGSAYPQFMGFGMKMAGVMMPLMSNPKLGEKIGDLLDGMPEAQ